MISHYKYKAVFDEFKMMYQAGIRFEGDKVFKDKRLTATKLFHLWGKNEIERLWAVIDRHMSDIRIEL